MSRTNLSETELTYKGRKYKREVDEKGVTSWYSPEGILVPDNLFDILESECEKNMKTIKNIIIH